MLPAETQRHSHDEILLDLPPGQQLGPPDDEVVCQHAADHRKNHAHVKAADPTHSFAAHVGRERRVDMYLGCGEFFRHARMTLAACPGEIGPVDRGPWITRRKNAVGPVATGAVRDYLRTASGREAVIAGQVGSGAPAFDAKLL